LQLPKGGELRSALEKGAILLSPIPYPVSELGGYYALRGNCYTLQFPAHNAPHSTRLPSPQKIVTASPSLRVAGNSPELPFFQPKQ
jgi:hypothetical protein